MEGSTVGLGDAMLMAQGGNGFGGNWAWIILLFLLLGNNGWGGNNQCAAEMAAAKTQASVWQSNDQQNLMGAIGQVRDGNIALGNGIADATFALNQNVSNGFTGVMRDGFGLQSAMMGGFANVAQAVAENRFAQQNCCCETNRNIDAVRYDAALNTQGINATATANTQRILDKLCSMETAAKDAEIANLRQQLAGAQLTVSQQAQNAAIIGAIRPYPAPAYMVASPYGNACPCAGV